MSRRPAPSTSLADSFSPLRAPPLRSTEPANSVPTPTSSTPEKHPFANTTSKLEVVRPSISGDIDVEEEVKLYDDLCCNYEAETDNFIASCSSSPSRLKRRSAPTPPPESIFSAEIYLSDNTGKSHPHAFASDVQVTGWTTVAGDKPPFFDGGQGKGKGASMVGLGGGAYVVYDCVITTKEGTSFHALKRYTAFEDLDATLHKTLPRRLRGLIPPLPPKAPFARFRPAFLDQRRRKLQFYLASILLNPEVGGEECVRRWVIRS